MNIDVTDTNIKMENHSMDEESMNMSTNATFDVYYQGYTDADYLEAILQHIQLQWYQWIYVALFVLIFCVGITGNALVCYSVLSSKYMKVVVLNYFLVNLAVADMLVLVICLPASVSNDILQSWFLGSTMCKITTYLQVSNTQYNTTLFTGYHGNPP